MKISLSKDQKRFLISTALLVIILVVVVYVVFYPRVSQALSLRKELITESEKWAEIQAQIKPYLAVKDRQEAGKRKRAELETKFPKEREISLLLQQLERITHSLDLEIISCNRKPPVVKNVFVERIKKVADKGKDKDKKPPKPKKIKEVILTYKQIPLEMEIQGKYQSIGAFLESLNQMKWLVSVQEFDIQSLGQEEEEIEEKPKEKEMVLTITLNIITYTLK